MARSRSVVTEALAVGGLDQLARYTKWTQPPSLRRILIDLIEEYARHVGHGDLIRESVDGLTGEDPRADGGLPSSGLSALGMCRYRALARRLTRPHRTRHHRALEDTILR